MGNDTSILDREKSDFHFLTVEARDDLGRGNRNTAELGRILDKLSNYNRNTVWLTYPFDSGFCNLAMKKGTFKAVFYHQMIGKYLNIHYRTEKNTNILKITAFTKS